MFSDAGQGFVADPGRLCVGDYTADAALRSEFHRWLAQLWERKDAQIDALLARAALKNQ